MGTNFYARIIPTKERMEKLKKLIDEDDFSAIKEEVDAMYATIGQYCHEGGVVHIGKRSGGWKFLWNPNWYEEDNGHYDTDTKEWIPNPTIKKFYDLNRASILEFLKRDDVRLFDEYGAEYDPEEFMNEMKEWDEKPWINGKPKLDGKMYSEVEKEEGNTNMYDKYGDPHENMWKELGFDPDNFNFYSDGMRFSTFTDFS